MTRIVTSEMKKILCNNMAINLPSLRAKAGLSQHELANRLGFSRQTISAVENGKRKMQWSTYTAITLFFSKNQEIRNLMIVMGIINDSVETFLHIENKDFEVARDE